MTLLHIHYWHHHEGGYMFQVHFPADEDDQFPTDRAFGMFGRYGGGYMPLLGHDKAEARVAKIVAAAHERGYTVEVFTTPRRS